MLATTNCIVIYRYVRINTLQKEFLRQQIVHHFTSKYKLKWHAQVPTDETTADWIAQDEHLPDLLVLCPSTDIDFHKDDMCTKGHIIVQDKASCFPIFVLHHTMQARGMLNGKFDTMDACAAPGNKTSYAAALFDKNLGNVFAFDRSKPRYQTLVERMQQANATKVKCINTDFLQAKPQDYTQVRAIVVDPSCSGSGIVSRQSSM